MITAESKINKMLDEYPVTLDVLLRASTNFSKLKNKFLRKTLAGRVNVTQAASIAGFSLNELLLRLNDAIGKKEEFMKTINSAVHTTEQIIVDKPDVLKNISAERIRDIDVRPIIAAGADPLKNIMAFVKSLKPDEAMHLINSFEPIPLYSVLQKKGYDHWTEKLDNVFNVYFYKTNNVSNNVDAPSLSSPFNPDKISEESEIIEIDVRELEPPEPMLRVLETLSEMDDNTILVVHHHRDPLMLYEKLEERGFQAATHKIQENYYKIIITKTKV